MTPEEQLEDRVIPLWTKKDNGHWIVAYVNLIDWLDNHQPPTSNN
jgi:hypothetical protein